MRTLAAAIIGLLSSLALAQPLPQPMPPGSGGSCPHGYPSSRAPALVIRGLISGE